MARDRTDQYPSHSILYVFYPLLDVVAVDDVRVRVRVHRMGILVGRIPQIGPTSMGASQRERPGRRGWGIVLVSSSS